MYLVTQSYLTLCDPMDCSLPDSTVHGDSPGKNTGVGFHALLQGIFPIQGLNPGLLHCRWVLLMSEPPGKPNAVLCNSYHCSNHPASNLHLHVYNIFFHTVLNQQLIILNWQSHLEYFEEPVSLKTLLSHGIFKFDKLILAFSSIQTHLEKTHAKVLISHSGMKREGCCIKL